MILLPAMMLTAPALASAAGLVPCGGTGEAPCTTDFIAPFVAKLIKFLFGALGVIATIVMVYAGFRMVVSAGNESEWTAAKKMFTNVVIGIILILASWLIVDTILQTLTGKGLNEWSDFSSSNASTAATVAGSTTAVAAAGKYTDAEARAALAAAGIGVNKTIAQGTSLDNINQATIADAINLKSNCGCSVTITAGTENGHAAGTYSHGSGNKYDIRPTTALDNYIKTNYTPSGVRSSDNAALYTSPSGSVYAKEGNHWDVLVK